MAFDFPPPLPPQQAEISHEERAAAGKAIDLQAGSARMLVMGNRYLSEQRIREVTDAGRTVSDKILLLNALYSAAGYPLVNVVYARDGNTVYVLVHEGVLTEVEAPALLAPYFEKFVGRRDVRTRDMEPMRALAALKAERAGIDVDARFAVDDPQSPADVTLRLDARNDPQHRRWRLSGTFGNPGNRFLGRYFGATELRHATRSGDQIGVGFTTAFTGLGDSRGGRWLDRFEGSYDTVTRYGLYGAKASFTRYAAADFDAVFPGTGAAQRVDSALARISDASIVGGQFLMADPNQRWTLEQEIGYVDSTLRATPDADGGGGLLDWLIDLLPGFGNGDEGEVRLQDEQYAYARIGSRYTRSMQLRDRRASLLARAGYAHGLSDDSGTLDRRSTTVLQRTARFRLLDAGVEMRRALPYALELGLLLEGQYALRDRQLPQQQQWVLGGPDRLGAFLPGILVGDSGSYARAQLRLPRWHLLNRPYRISLLVDHGTARFNAADGDAGSTRHAATYGLRLEASPLPHVELSLLLADDLSTRNVDAVFADDLQTHIFFSLRARW